MAERQERTTLSHTTEQETERRFGRYRVRRELGKGGMGSVYLAHDEMLGRDVAVKTIFAPPAGASAMETLRSRFMNEARAIATLSHPYVVNVFDAGVEGDTPYLVMEVVAGPSLKEQLAAEGPLDTSAACALGIQIAQALQEAHDAGIVHRDVKPANILRFKPGQWKLGDFGVARVPDSSITLTGQFLGTPAYAAPETLAEGLFAPSCDVYALAATLYEAVAGSSPFPRSPQLRMAAIASGDGPRPLRDAAPHVPGDLAEVIARGLEVSPGARPSAAAFAEALATVSVGAGAPSPASPEPATAATAALPEPRPTGRNARRLGIAFALAALAAASGGIALLSRGGVAGGEAEGAAGAAIAHAPGERADASAPEEAREPAGFDAVAAEAQHAPIEFDAAPAAEAVSPDAAPAQPEIPELDAVKAQLRAGKSRAALASLETLQRRHPDVAEIRYLMGRVYFGRMWWSQGFDNHRAAIEIDPSYRHDERLIADAIEALKGNKRSRAMGFLHHVIGEPAIPQLREATERRDSKKIPDGARSVLRRLGAD